MPVELSTAHNECRLAVAVLASVLGHLAGHSNLVLL